MKIKSTRQRGCFFVGWKASADQGEAPSISPIRGSAWLPLEILERLYWSSEESDGSDQSDKQISQQNLGLVRPVRLVREHLKSPEKLTRAFLLKEGEILRVVLSTKISAVFFLFRERKNWPKSCGKRRFRGIFAFFRPISIKLSPILFVGLLIVSADAIRMSADSLIVLTNTIRKTAHRKGIFFALSIERAVSSHSQRRKTRIVLTKNKESDQPEAEGARWLVATRGTPTENRTQI